MCSETSPRISFSNDLNQEGDTQISEAARRDTTLLDSNSEFEFSICSSLDHESSSADELFADGMILPVQIQDNVGASRQTYGFEPPGKVTLPPPLLYTSDNENHKKESMRKIVVVNPELEEKHHSKSFWGFKRSSSVNCDIRKSICSLPLLSRSKSTGSVPNPKRVTLKDHTQKHISQRPQSNSMAKSLSTSASSAYTYVYSLPQKPPLKKNYGGSHGNGLRINPVLNVPPPYISKGTANLFGLASFLGNGKEKKIRK